MEHMMKISSDAVRRLRLERGWSQDQLSVVSGVSLRTVQRVEAQGLASISTAVSLAATYGVQLTELQEAVPVALQERSAFQFNVLFIGIAVVTLAGLNESIRIGSLATSNFVAAMNVTAAIAGAVLLVPALLRLYSRGECFAALLALLGTPLLTLLMVGFAFSVMAGRFPNLNLMIFGAAGIIFVIMAYRDLRRGNQGAGA